MKPRFSRASRFCTTIFAGVLATASQSSAVDYSWTGANNGSWNLGGNWSGTVIPGIADDLTILGPLNVGGPLNIEFDADNSARSISFTNTAATSILNTTSGADKILTLGSGGITTGAGAVQIGSTTVNQGVNITLGAAQAWNIGAGGMTFFNSIGGLGTGITKTGSGLLTLNSTAVNTFTGGLNVNGGTVNLDFINLATPTNLIASTNALQINSGSLRITGKDSAANTSQSFSGTTLGGGFNTLSLAKGASATSATLNLGALTITPGSITTIITGAVGSTTWTTAATPTSEILQVTSIAGKTLPVSAGIANAINVNAGLFYRQSTNAGAARWVSVDNLGNLGPLPAGLTAIAAGTNDARLGFQLANSANIALTASTNPVIYGLVPNASGTATLTTPNSGTLTLNGIIQVNTGASTINAGTGTSNLVIGSERNLVINMDNSGALNINAPIANNGGGASGVTIASTMPTGTPGTVTFGGANTFTGRLSVVNSRLSIASINNVSANGVLGNSALSVILGGSNGQTGTLAYTAATGSSTKPFTMTTGGTGAFDVTTALTLSGNIDGGGGLTKLGAGILTLSGGSTANTYTGLTTVSAGTLQMNKTAGTDAIAGNVSIGAGTLTNLASNQIADTATVTMSSATAQWFLNGQSETVATVDMQNAGGGNAGLRTGTAGKLTVTGTLTHTLGDIDFNSSGVGGQSTISVGSLINTGGTTTFGVTDGTQSLVIGAGGLTIGGGSTIAVNASAAAANFISLGGNVTSQANATVNTISGAGTLRLNATRTFDVANGAATSDLTISTIVADGSGVSGITKNGAGTFTLAGANTYTGVTTINGGRLIIDDGSIAGSSGIVNNASLEYKLNTNSRSYANGISGGGDLTKTGTNTLNLTGTNTYTGATLISGGTLQVSGTGNLSGTSGITINGSGAKYLRTSSVAGTAPVTLTQGTLTGSGTVGPVTVANSLTAIISNNNGVAGASLTTGNLTFSGVATLDLFSDGVSTSALVSAGTVTTTTPGILINATALSWSSGTTYDLLGYTSLSGALTDFTKGTITGLGGRQNSSLVLNGNNIALSVTGDSVRWTGAASTAWTTTPVGAPFNWITNTGLADTEFLATDDVIFNDSAAGVGAVTVDISGADVSPNTVLFSNTTRDYTITGSNGIATGNLAVSGGGIVTLTTANTYAGATTISNGILNLTGSLSGTAITVSGNSVLSESSTGVIGGAASLTHSSSGTSTLAGTNTYAGATTISNGTLRATTSASALGTGTLTLAGGQLQLANDTGLSFGRNTTVTANAQITSDTLTAVAGVTHTQGTLSIGGQTLTIAKGGNATGTTAGVTFGATTLTGAPTFSIGTASTLSLGAVTNAGNTATVTGAGNFAQTGTFSGLGGLTLDSGFSGTATLTGTGTNYSGATTISGGKLVLSSTNAFASAVTVNAGTTLQYSPTTNSNQAAAGAISLIGTMTYAPAGNSFQVLGTSGVNKIVTVSGGSSVINISPGGTFAASTGGLYLDGGLQGSSALTVNATTDGFGLVLRTAGSTYSGAMTVTGNANITPGMGSGLVIGGLIANELSNADLQIDGTLELGKSTAGMGWAATATASGTSVAIDALSGTGKIVANFTSGTNTRNLSVGNNGGSGSFSGEIANGTFNTLSLTKNGIGTQTLTGTNTYTGATTISGGTLALSGSNNILADTNPVNVNNSAGTFDISAITTSETIGSLAGVASSSVVLGSKNLTVGGGGTAFDGVISGTNGTLTKTGSGALTLSGTNTYTGNTSISGAGSITASNAQSFGIGGTVSLASTHAAGTTTASLTVTGGVAIANAINIDAATGRTNIYSTTGNNTLSGPIAISGTGSNINLFSNGVAGSVFTLNNTITGSTFNSALVLRGATAGATGLLSNTITLGPSGVLQTNSGSSVWTISSTGNTWATTDVLSTTTLKLGATDALATGSILSGISTATLDLAGFNQSFVGLTGSTTIGNSSTTSNSQLSVNTGITPRSFAGVIQDTAGGAGTQKVSLLISGGNQTLTGDSTYTGATNVNSGTLVINGNISTSTSLSVASLATLGGIGTIGAATISGILAPGNSIGTLTANGDVTWNASGGNAWVFELGMASVDLAAAALGSNNDLLNITGGNDFLKGTGSAFTFDFANLGAVGVYKLVDWDGSTTFSATDFAASNLASGLTGDFIVDSGTSALYLNVIPEPSTALLSALGALALLRRRR